MNRKVRAQICRFLKLVFVAILWWTSVILVFYTVGYHYKIPNEVPKDIEVNVTNWWVPVTEKVFIYSAFHDTRGGKNVIRIVGIGPRTDTSFGDFTCVAEGSSTAIKLDTTFEVMPEHHDAQNSAVFFVCRLTENVRIDKIGLGYRDRVPVWISVQRNVSLFQNESKKLTVCIRPMYSDALILPRIPEFIQGWMFLGASHFVFYDYKTPPKAREILLELSRRGLASIEFLPWNLPVSEDTIHCEGQLAFLQDCLYRTMGKYDWLAPVDLDEYMIPIKNISLLKLIEDHRETNLAGYEVQHALFCLINFTGGLLTQNVLYRNTNLGGGRSKHVYLSKNVEMLGIHFPWRIVKGTKKAKLSPEVVLMNHYRTIVEFFDKKDCIVKDDRALRMRDSLINSDILKTYQKL